MPNASRSSSVAATLTLAGGLLWSGQPWSGSALARSAGFYVGGAYYRESPEPRAPRRRAPREATVPLPVPRPRFPDDAAASRESHAASSAPRPLDASSPPAAVPSKGTRPDGSPPLPPEKPTTLDASPDHGATGKTSPVPTTGPVPPIAPETPAVAASGATTASAPRSPAADPDCPARLTARHVEARTIAIGPQPDARCTVVEPVSLSGLVLADGSKVDFPDHPTIACTTADVFSLYVRDLLVPLSKGTFASPVQAVWTGPGLECRSRDHIFGARLSAHGQGLAIDIARLKLADGRLIEVGQPKTDTDTAFESASRAAACGYFHTVLGPGSDSYHRTHWHFDLEVRGATGDGKYCR